MPSWSNVNLAYNTRIQYSQKHSVINHCDRRITHLGDLDYISKFKTELRKEKDISQVPKHYKIGHEILKLHLMFCFFF
jgi:hypothetical protein